MSFSCPPAELVFYTLEKLAFCGQYGVALTEMWAIISEKMGSPVDEFQKQVIWEWLFFCNKPDEPLRVYIMKNGSALTILPNYAEFLKKEGGELSLTIVPTADTQWKYLTGLSTSKKLKLQLGDHPFQLLCEIAKYGKEGIYSPDLCKATDQDPRSLPLRLRKLEELGLIVKRSIYNEQASQHTNLCIHSKFANSDVQSSTFELGEDFEASRNVYKLKQFIMQSVKDAPNSLRGFKDLKSELKLDKNKSSSKFFRGIIEFLHTHGYVERLMVKDPNDFKLVYCIKYIKDIPKDSDEISDYVDFLSSLDDRNPEEEDFDTIKLPLINKFFPISNQIYQIIKASRTVGLTSMEINRCLTGVSDYRPFLKLLDSLTSFLINDTNLQPLKPYEDPYPNISIVRAYDFEGKYKFYRYFSRPFQQLPLSKEYSKKQTSNSIKVSTIAELNKLLYKPLSKVPKGALYISKKRKLIENSLPKSKKQKSTVTSSTKKPRNNNKDKDKGLVTDKVLKIEKESDSPMNTINESDYQVEPIQPPEKAITQNKKRQIPNQLSNSSGSLKASKRRVALIDIIKSLNGVTYTTTKLCRLLDEKLGNSTVTDKKTLARDVSILIANEEIEVQNISFIRSGQEVSRKLLILTDPKLRPSNELIENMKKQCIEDNGTKFNSQISRRIIEGEVKLYSKNPSNKALQSRSRKGRLDSLTEGEIKESNVPRNKLENVSSKLHFNENILQNTADLVGIEDSNSLLSSLVSRKHKRKKKSIKKKDSSNNFVSKSSRRFRSIKFDTSDATTLFRSVVISKAFKKGIIDFEEIASLFIDMNAKEVKQKWTVVRKQIGGLPAVVKGTEEFEFIVIKGIDDGLVSSDDLENINFEFFLDLWKDSDNSVLEVSDKMPLYSSIENNLNEYRIVQSNDSQPDLFDQLEDNSMRQKEAILSGTAFYQHAKTDIRKKEYDELRTILKAIFSTSEENFSSTKVTQILSQYGEDETQRASAALIKDKEISYYSLEDSNTRFILTDKVFNALVSRIFTPRFFKQASSFKEMLSSLLEDRKGLILSQGVTSCQMACLLHFISDGTAMITRLDKSYKFNGYESRLIDKDKLACDIVVVGCQSKSDTIDNSIIKIPVPTGKACSHIWLDLNGNINSHLWAKIIISILYYVNFRPGIPANLIYNKMQAVLGLTDFNNVIDWLLQSNCLIRGHYNDLKVTSGWFSILGF